MNSKRTILWGVLVALALVGTTGALASGQPAGNMPGGAPAYFNYQGLLLDPATGEPVADGDYNLTFAIYDDATSTDPADKLWEQTLTVPVQSGLFNVLLGGIDAAWVDGRNLWLGITVQGESEMTPRQQLVSVPYAIYAQNVGPHNHLGQTWSGGSSALVVSGSFSNAPNNAPLVLSNSHASSDGLRVMSAGRYGLYVGAADYGLNVGSADNDGVYVTSADGDGFSVASAGDEGVYVYQAGDDGVYVHKAGAPSATNPSTAHNGFEVGGAQGYGLYVGQAGLGGVRVESAGYDGLYVGSAYVGVNVASATNKAGHFGGDVEITEDLVVGDQLEVNGPAIGFFPRPAWNSGWVAFADGGETRTLTHDLGGNAYDYFVDLQCMSSTGNIHILYHGGDWSDDGIYDVVRGAYYGGLTSSTIAVRRESSDEGCDYIRIRIWVIQ